MPLSEAENRTENAGKKGISSNLFIYLSFNFLSLTGLKRLMEYLVTGVCDLAVFIELEGINN